MKNILSIFSLIIATIVGAGFSSGKEILIYFNNTNNYAIFNIIVSSIVIFITIYFVLDICKTNNIYDYSKFISFITNEKIGNKINFAMKIFLSIIFFIMISGFGSFVSEVFNLPNVVGSIILAIIVYITLQFNINGIMKISNYIVPVIIIGIMMLFSLNIGNNYNYYLENTNDNSSITSGLIYASYNLVIAIPIIVNSSKKVDEKKQILLISILSSLTTLILVYAIYYILNSNLLLISNIDMPLLYISKNINRYLYFYYILVICFSIYSTAISTLYSIVSKYENNKKVYNFYSICLAILSIIVSNIGFSTLVNYGFRFIGYFGIFQFILLLKKYIDSK